MKLKRIIWLIILLAGGVLLFFNYAGAFAQEPKYTHIAIEYSETCNALIELGDYETCGNPELMLASYPDAKLKPGFQIMFDNSAKTDATYYQKHDILLNHKKSCVKENYCNVFDNYGFVYYWYNPDQQIRSYYDKVITINAHMKHTNLNVQNDQVFVTNNTRTLILDTNQINIRSCQQIAVTLTDWRQVQEMGGLMWYIIDDCKDIEKLGVLKQPYTKELTLTQYSPLDSPAWLELQRLKNLEEQYKDYRIGTD